MDNFVVVGSGSAGRRHALALRALYPNARITIVKRSLSKQPLEVVRSANIHLVSTIDECLQPPPDLVVIASPATMHFADLLLLSQSCSTFLLEKPIAATSRDGEAICELSAARGLKIVVGHHLRFSETPLMLKNEIRSEGLHSVASLSLSYGQHLRYWRPGVPEEASVTAVKSLGGGVLRELSHEIDAVTFLGERPHRVKYAQLSFDGAPTDGLVETMADFSLMGKTLMAHIHLDMTTETPFRHWEASFSNFTIRADLLNGKITKIANDGSSSTLHESTPGERDRAAISLLEFVTTGRHEAGVIEPCDVAQGTHILNTIEAIEKSAKFDTPVDIAE